MLMGARRLLSLSLATWVVAPWLSGLSGAQPSASQKSDPHAASRFQTSDNCLACHNSLMSPSGEDVSIGSAWRASMMAHSARDPYWQAGVRRELIDHPAVAEVIEDECSICHMPMARAEARRSGAHGQVFRHLPIGSTRTNEDLLAADGVSCTLCHQIGPDRLGTPESFTGGFVLQMPEVGVAPTMSGPFEVDEGRSGLMRSATGAQPGESAHVRSSEFCATCHTLITQAFGPNGEVVGRLPEQVPFLEWQHSSLRETRSCQSCHMPVVEEPSPISSVLGDPREEAGRHTFLGGNFFMLRMLNRFRNELGVEAPPTNLDAAAQTTLRQLQTVTAALAIAQGVSTAGHLAFDVDVRNLTGHKLPTGYPSRRTWLHVTVRDAGGGVVFESGAISTSGAIEGNDNDADASRFEPHYEEITSPEQVQIYEAVMGDGDNAVTTGLLRAVGYLKDNRLLPHGFDKSSADDDIRVHGEAVRDASFGAGGDRVRYVATTGSRQGPFDIEIELRYQPIAFRWANNLRPYESFETRRFVRYYETMASGSSTVLATVNARAQ